MTLKEICETTGLNIDGLRAFVDEGIIQLYDVTDEDRDVPQNECDIIKRAAVLIRLGVSPETVKDLMEGRISMGKALALRDRDGASEASEHVADMLLEDGETWETMHADHLLMLLENGPEQEKNKPSAGETDADLPKRNGGRWRSTAGFIAVCIEFLIVNFFARDLNILHSIIFLGGIVIIWLWLMFSNRLDGMETEKSDRYRMLLNGAAVILTAGVICLMIFL